MKFLLMATIAANMIPFPILGCDIVEDDFATLWTSTIDRHDYFSFHSLGVLPLGGVVIRQSLGLRVT